MLKITKEKLIDLYITQQKTLLEISEILDISYSYLHTKFERFNIPRRSHDNPKWRERIGKANKEKHLINKDKLYDLYINQNKTQNEIADIFNCAQRVIHSRLRKYNIRIRPLSEIITKWLIGEKSPHWKGGITSINHKRLTNSKWKKIATEQRKRDNYICQQCGKYPVYDVHHIIPWRISHNDDEDNLITLCRNCHVVVDKNIQVTV